MRRHARSSQCTCRTRCGSSSRGRRSHDPGRVARRTRGARLVPTECRMIAKEPPRQRERSRAWLSERLGQTAAARSPQSIRPGEGKPVPRQLERRRSNYCPIVTRSASLATVPAFMELWSKHDEVNHHFRRYRKEGFIALFKQEELVFASYFNSLLFTPIYAMRMFSKLFPKKLHREGSGSDFGLVKSPLLNKIFYQLFLSENILLSRRISFPFGVSLLGLWRKK